MQVKVITLHQPWATLIARKQKFFETRSWPTQYRGPLLIHAAKKKPSRALLAKFGLTLEDCPLGKSVALANLEACLKMDAALIRAQPPEEIAAGDWQSGRFAWQLTHIRPYPNISLKGQQGLWDEDILPLTQKEARPISEVITSDWIPLGAWKPSTPFAPWELVNVVEVRGDKALCEFPHRSHPLSRNPVAKRLPLEEIWEASMEVLVQ